MANVLQLNLCEYPGAANYNHVIDIVVKVDNIQHFYYIKEGVNVNIVVKVDNFQHF
jgi:hypothetical protein